MPTTRNCDSYIWCVIRWSGSSPATCTCSQRGWTDLPLRDAVLRDPYLVPVTRYCTQITPFIHRFGRDRVLFVEFNELTRQREQTLQRIAAFIDLDPTQFDRSVRSVANASVGKTTLHRRFDHPSLPLRLVRRLAPSAWRRIADNSNRAFHTRPRLSAEVEDVIWNSLELEIRGLEELMGRSLESWRPGTHVD